MNTLLSWSPIIVVSLFLGIMIIALIHSENKQHRKQSVRKKNAKSENPQEPPRTNKNQMRVI